MKEKAKRVSRYLDNAGGVHETRRAADRENAAIAIREWVKTEGVPVDLLDGECAVNATSIVDAAEWLADMLKTYVRLSKPEAK